MNNPRFKIKSKKKSGNSLSQMPFISWTERMSVNVKLLDNDNKRLAILINELHHGVMAGRDKQALDLAFEWLIGNIHVHFAHETQLFVETGYPDAAFHELEHDNLLDRFKDLLARFKSETELSGYLEVMNLAKGWLFGHIQSSDQDYVPHLKAMDADFLMAKRQSPIPVMRG